MSPLLRNCFIAFVCLFLPGLVFAQQLVRDRVTRPINTANYVPLKGTLHPRARAEFDRGPVAPTLQLDSMTLVFQRTSEQEAALQKLLAEQQDRSSTNYHKWLTPTEFGERFGLSQHDVDVVAAWLRSQGFAVTEIAPSRTSITFSGIAAQVQAAFHAPLHNYFVDGKLHYAPSAELSVPESISGIVLAVTSLNDFHPKPHAIVHHKTLPRLTSSISGSHFLAPGDFGVIYDLPDYVASYDANAHIQIAFQSGIDGTGQTIAVVGQAAGTSKTGIRVGTGASYISSDDATFRGVSQLPSGTLTVTPTGISDPTHTYFDPAELTEANLDVEWSGAVAPNASRVFVYSPSAFQSLQYIITNKLAQVVSISYGDCEAHFTQTEISGIEGVLSQANSQGMTVVAAAGDNLATDCDGTPQNPVNYAKNGLAVDYPASSAYVTGVGGADFYADINAQVSNNVAAPTQYWDGSSDPNSGPSAFSYIPEQVWNDYTSTTFDIGTGGGVSKQFSKPTWQVNGTPNDGQRDVPDLSFAASPEHDGYLICSQGSCQTGYRSNSDQTFTVVGGTSAAAPSFAGVMALVNQKLGNAQGNINPSIYTLANGTENWAFHDIGQLDNKAACQLGTTDCPTGGTIGYSAAHGYDVASGWGSVDVSAFLNALANTPNPSFYIARQQGTLVAGPDAAAVYLGFYSTQGFSGNVTFACSSSNLPGISCPGNVSFALSPSFPVLSNFPFAVEYSNTYGTLNGVITFTGTSGSTTSTLPLPATITYRDFNFNNYNPTVTVNAGSSQTETVDLLFSEFDKELDVTCTTDNPQVTCSPATTTFTDPGNFLTMLTYTIASTGPTATTSTVTITGTSNPLTHSVQLAVTVIVPDFSIAVSNPTLYFSSGGSGTTTVTVTPGQGFASDVALSCSVSGSLGSTSCSLSPATVAGGNGSATLTIQAAKLSMNRGAPLRLWPGGGALTSLAFAIGATLTTNPRRRGKRRNRAARALFSVLLLAVLLPVISCGGGGGGSSSNNSGPTTLSGTVTVTGTGGGQTHTTSVNVNIT